MVEQFLGVDAGGRHELMGKAYGPAPVRAGLCDDDAVIREHWPAQIAPTMAGSKQARHACIAEGGVRDGACLLCVPPPSGP
jgi:hypothetical protein